MKNEFNVKKLFTRILLIVPLVYIACGWLVGLNYGCKSIIFGPYPDVPVVLKTGLLGCSLEYISGAKAMMMVIPLKNVGRDTEDSTYFKRRCYFELPGAWTFDKSDHNLKKPIILTGSLSRAICYDPKNTNRSLGSLSVEELNDFLIRTGRAKDARGLKPYLFIARFEKKYPYVYSETVLLSRAMGNIFKDNSLPYDILGLVGIAVLFIAFATRSLFLWMYYLYWIFSYWLGRIGYHDPILAFSIEGWQVILWSFWHGFIVSEGRLFLIIAVEGSIIYLGIAALYMCMKNNVFLKGAKEEL